MKYIVLFLFFPLIVFSQNNNFVMGINGGLYIANQNTSIQYNGNYNNYGVISILNNPLNQTKFDQFFQYPYEARPTGCRQFCSGPAGGTLGKHVGRLLD